MSGGMAKLIVFSTFLAFTALSATVASQALGVTYKTTVIDLTPTGFSHYIAYRIGGTQQVGWGYGPATGNNDHALLWNGTAASCIDLHPSIFLRSWAMGTNGKQQVGSGEGSVTGGNTHALLWNGSADNYIDLHQFLPSEFANSFALAIDGYGNISGSAMDGLNNQHAIFWQVIPEPATLLFLGLGGLFLRKRKH